MRARRRRGRAPALPALLIALAAGCGGEEPGPGAIQGASKPPAVVAFAAAAQRDAYAGLGTPAQRDGRAEPKQILFGDLHVHTSYSWDALLATLPLVGGEGVHPPADACDFARYCADLDFFALTDHAESLSHERWELSKQSVQRCNAVAGDPRDPDLVALLGFEWSQAGLTPETHWGHRCVIFPGTDDGELPARPIGASDGSERYARIGRAMGWVRWGQPFHWRAYTSVAEHFEALAAGAVCPEDVDTRELPLDCFEVAPTPRDLYEKLDRWGLEALAIPHGTAWGTYTPATSSLDKHLDPGHYDPERQSLIEIMSGHGNSEEQRAWREFEVGPDGSRRCPEPSADYLPCCWQAGEIMRSRCGDLPQEECERRVEEARRLSLEAYVAPQQVFPDADPAEWLDCGQCRDCFKPSYGYRPRESVQYAMALARPGERAPDGAPLRFRYGFVASSDNHTARPGTGYKQLERGMMTDVVGTPGLLLRGLMRLGRRMDDPQRPERPRAKPVGVVGVDDRVQSFLYPGGLAALHARGRSREAVWEALRRREVYGTSGPRILLWFDLLNAGAAPAPMGSEVALGQTPRFEVRAVGDHVQLPGCPAWAGEGLHADRIRRLCRDECRHPGELRHAIVSIEVVRIRPQSAAGEPIAPLVEDPWRVLTCEPDASGCVVRFEDPDFVASGRDALYYVRALQEPTPAINGAPLRSEFDASGRALATHPCSGPGTEDGCPAPVQERAWSSPIFVNQVR